MTHDTPAWTAGIHLAQVLDVADPQGSGRIRVGLTGLGLTLWAPVLIPGGGAGYGVALTPRNGETVAVAFPGGDPAQPLVLGALWSGQASRPEAAGAPGESYAIVAPGGAAIRIEDGSGPSIVIASDDRTRLRIEPGPEGMVSIEHPAGSITLGPEGVAVTSAGAVRVSAATVSVSTAMLTIDAGMVRASGVVQCDTLIANTVVAASYTPGAGNLV